MEAHPLCRILPEMTDSEFSALVEDIRTKGLLRPITTFEGMILDGRHRFRACGEAGVAPRLEPYTGSDPVGFVQSCCTHRNLTSTQRAMVAAGFMEYERQQARKRQQAAQNNHAAEAVRVNLPEQVEPGRARDKAGARMGVSGSQVDHAAKVIAKAAPEVVEKCKNGEMALNEAKRIVDLNPAAQRRIAEMPKQQRAKEIETAHARSLAAKTRDNRNPVVEAPGTPFVRTVLSGVERLSMYAAEQGLKSGGDIAAKFGAEMDWSSAPLLTQLERAEPIIRALSIILQGRASKAA